MEKEREKKTPNFISNSTMVCKPLLESKQNKIQCRSKNPRFSTNSQTAKEKQTNKPKLFSANQQQKN
jgi:hypothetical protein